MMIPAMALAILAVAAQESDEAKKARALFDSMAEKLSAAKTVRLKFAFDGKERKTGNVTEQRKGSGEWLLAAGDKQFLVSESKLNPEDEASKGSFGWVSDGKRIQVLGNGQALSEEEVKAGTNEFHLKRYALGGIWRGLLAPAAELVSAERGDEPCEFAPVRNEKIGRAETKVLRFKIRMDPKGEKPWDVHVTLWLNAQTLLPVKRVEGPKPGEQDIVETYSEFKLDGEIDAKKFALKPPK